MKRYRIKFVSRSNPTEAQWSGWKPLADPIEEGFVLVVQFEQPLTAREIAEFFNRFSRV